MSEELRVRDVMTYNPITVKPTASIKEVAKLMADNKIGSVIVVNDDGDVVGIITERDLVERVLAAGKDPSTLIASDVMTTRVYVISPDASIKDAADLMARRNIGHLPVVEGRKLVGIISERDIIVVAPEIIELLYVRSGESSTPKGIELE